MIKQLTLCLRSRALVLAFGMTPLIWGMESDMPGEVSKIKASIVERYSDEIPKIKQVFKGPCPESFYEYCGNSRFNIKYFKVIKAHLAKAGFEELGLNYEYFFDGVKRDPVLFFGNLKTAEFMLCLFQNRTELKPSLESFKAKIHDSVFSSKKWSYPGDKLYWTGKYETLNDMSLRYLDCFIHCNTCCHGCKPWEKVFYEQVQSKGLENSIYRLIIVFNKKDEWNISVPYEDKNAEEWVKKNLISL